MRRFRDTLLLLLLSCLAQAAELPEPVRAALSQRGLDGSGFSVFVHEIGASEPLLAYNAEVPRNPASAIKALTTYAGLELLGPAHQWQTRAYYQGSLRDGVLEGDLILQGGGDPFLVIENFWLLLQGVRDRGVQHISGNLVLDTGYLRGLGSFDGVYAWGVLHHTGNLEQALENAALVVKPGGWLFLAIYQDQGWRSRCWQRIKRAYCSGTVPRVLLSALFIPLFALLHVLVGLLKYRHPLGQFIHYKRRRGMSIHHDWIDWLGGYPFEVARPEVIFQFYRRRGFVLENLLTTCRLGCNEFVFRRGQCANDAPTPSPSTSV